MNVLLVSTGYPASLDGNFGNSHLVALGSYLQANSSARVRIIDLDYEAFLDDPRPAEIFSEEYDLVGVSCYSSFDFLKAYYVGEEIRRRRPDVCLVTGGYHPSARPQEFVGPEHPFDHVVVGEGERALVRLVEALSRGERLPETVLEADPLPDLDALPPLDWSLMDRYRPVARRIGGQLTIALSRGCPFDCAFCMEGAKGAVGWRAWSPARAVEELQRVHHWLDLAGWSVFLTDPVFGLQPAWRREFLERLPRAVLPVSAWWALSRVDVLDLEDLPRFRAARFGLGFGLESGDPSMLQIIGKRGGRASAAAAYLDRFLTFAEGAEALALPWGANVIAGHPGETPERLEQSARWVRDLFHRRRHLTGSLSVDPYRFYPGSRIDHERASWEREHGARFHRPRWWNYSEAPFNATWVDASSSLGYRRRERMLVEHYGPILRDIAQRFDYDGYAADYFRRAVDEQVELLGPAARIPFIRDYCLWRRLTGDGVEDAREDPEAGMLLRESRRESVQALEALHGAVAAPLRTALVEVARERFVDEEWLWESSQDEALPLTSDGHSTLSAMHAYVVNYRLLELRTGDRLLELGGGSGYGAALASEVVGPSGAVHTVEFDPVLAARAGRLLADRGNVTVESGPAAPSERYAKQLFCFLLEDEPEEFLRALPVGGCLVAPLRVEDGRQLLVRWDRRADGWDRHEGQEVRYGLDRASARLAASP